MAHAVVVLFDDKADTAVRGLWSTLAEAGLPPADRFPPHVTFAVASDIPQKTRAALKSDLRVLSIPALWLQSLSTFSTSENVLMLAAVTDGELLAVHSAVHDVLAGKVRNPNSYYVPGSWVPHCTLLQRATDAQIVSGFSTLFPVRPIQARARQVAILDTATGELDLLV
ncbi:2'-5' RNA ligase family protein [Actinokineospora auranticolor]|uniref:2'-5' RNA ligase superfamily protein n=1 Tax=Actinokineospora auranticolor TaxID=155976 RepID=A0A2S6GE41_9PSEU|nr:2'-5' RNA ligase family protein [Actinokineospora auranticolor]PPK63483.1 2'-5' RNA ligase superfamily protein [Actinokineospora auranticolor]